MSVHSSGKSGTTTSRPVKARSSVAGKKKNKKRRSKPRPQYCFDGKARKGCKSQETGREEIDVTIFCPDTKQILDKRTLGDKEGERLAVIEMVSKIGSELPRGFVSADAGIVSPQITRGIIDKDHGYVLQIKGNSGVAYEEAVNLPWDRVVVASEERSHGHGRDEFRRVKALTAEFADLTEFEKYAEIGVVLQVERVSLVNKTGKTTREMSYYIGDVSFATLDLGMQARYIRDHWAQESYHWIKDKVMQEDNSMQRQPNGSRALATFRSLVAKFGRKVCDSPSRFIYRFSANPEKIVLNL